MHNAELYPDDATAPNAKAASVPAPNNAIDGLLPNHFNIINSEWLTNVVTWKFSGNQARILHAIYRHTTGFRKREDDMNGSRLEQITGIRYDHANEIVRKLAAKNILILRKGFYGFWMSINFNFSQWNQPNIEFTPDSNDPKQLLPEAIRNVPDDTGKSIDDDTNHVPQTPCNHQYTHPLETETAHNTATKTAPNHPPENTSTQATIEAPITAADLAKIEQHNKDLIKQSIGVSTDEILAVQKDLSAEMLNIVRQQIGDLGHQFKDSEILNQKIKGLNQQIAGLKGLDEKIQGVEDALEKQLQINQQHQLKNTDLENLIKQQFNQLKQQTENKNLAIQEPLPCESDNDLASYSDYIDMCDSEQNSQGSGEACSDNADVSIDYTEKGDDEQPIADLTINYKLHFPVQFTPDIRTHISNTCARYSLDKSTATILLDYMEQRRLRDPREVYNPVGYFFELAMNIDNGELDIAEIKAQLSPTLSSKPPRKMYAPIIAPKRDLSLYYIRLKELKKDYQNSKDQHTYYEGHFAQIAEEDQITFDQVVNSGERQTTWNNSVNNLNITHNAITEYVKDSPI